jgi:glycosyltransferase involved in cell wall biosynthesis
MRALIFAYACEPDQGSEPGAGWVWSRMIATMGEVWVITRANNRARIEGALPRTPEGPRMHFEYVDLPRRALFWKRGGRGAHLYYLLWQAAALARARKLSRQGSFDLVWHLTWANAWLGSFACLVRGRFVYGPVGGGVGMDWRLVRILGVRGASFELGRAMARTGARFLNPLARVAWSRAQLILVQNPETVVWLPPRHRKKAHVFPNVVLDERAFEWAHLGPRQRTGNALFVGRLLPWKGVALALHAVALLPGWRLTICGSGYDERRLRRIGDRLHVADRVAYLGWVPNDRAAELMRTESDVLLFPSIHDEGGWVVAEALACGLPVVCLDRGGPPVVGGTGVRSSSVSQTATELARAVLAADESTVRDFPSIDRSTVRLRSLLRSQFPDLDICGLDTPALAPSLRSRMALSDDGPD